MRPDDDEPRPGHALLRPLGDDGEDAAAIRPLMLRPPETNNAVSLRMLATIAADGGADVALVVDVTIVQHGIGRPRTNPVPRRLAFDEAGADAALLRDLGRGGKTEALHQRMNAATSSASTIVPCSIARGPDQCGLMPSTITSFVRTSTPRRHAGDRRIERHILEHRRFHGPLGGNFAESSGDSKGAGGAAEAHQLAGVVRGDGAAGR